MNDLINREDTIRELVKRSATDFMDVEAIATVIHIVNQMPSAETKPQWISCSERLPPLGEEVLVWAYDRCHLLTLYAYPNDEGYYWSVEDYNVTDDAFDKIIAWMPLPEYKGKE